MLSAWLWLGLVAAAETPLGPPPSILPTVAVDMSSLSAPAFERLNGLALERRILVRLVQENFAVVGVSQGPTVLIGLVERGAAIDIVTLGPAGELTSRVSATSRRLEETYLEIVQKAVDLARAQLTSSGEPSPAVEPPPAEPSARVVETRTPEGPGGPSQGLEADLRTGVAWRDHGTDVFLQLGVRWGDTPGAGAHAVLLGSASSGPGIRVREGLVGVGPGYRRAVLPSLTVDAVLLLGFWAHSFALADATLSDSHGTRIDAVAAVPLSLAYWPHEQVGMSLQLVPGIAQRAREHAAVERTVWRRGRVMMLTSLGIVGRW